MTSVCSALLVTSSRAPPKTKKSTNPMHAHIHAWEQRVQPPSSSNGSDGKEFKELFANVV
jgi:hypothetical protein